MTMPERSINWQASSSSSQQLPHHLPVNFD
jgi:hypothetical protein